MKTIVLLAAVALASCASDSHYVGRPAGPRLAPADPSPAPPRPGGSGYPVFEPTPGIVRITPGDRSLIPDRARWIPSPSPAPREDGGHGRIDPPRPICPEGPILGEPPRAPSPGSRFTDPSIARRVGPVRTVIPRAPEITPAPGMRRIDGIPRPSGTLATTAGRRVDLAPSTRIGGVIPSR